LITWPAIDDESIKELATSKVYFTNRNGRLVGAVKNKGMEVIKFDLNQIESGDSDKAMMELDFRGPRRLKM